MGTVFYQLFYRKQMMGIRPSIVALFGLAVALAEKCCERKTVGDKSYTLVKSGGTVPSGCLNSCLYTPDDDPSINVCFGLGNETSTCIGGSCTGPDFGPGPALPPWPCPFTNRTLLGTQCPDLSIVNTHVFTWQQCGWECNSNPNCYYWTYNEEGLTCTLFGEPQSLWGCYPVQQPNSTSGKKGCPIHPYTVQDKSYDSTCRPCGLCPCCWGVCLWNWYCTDGWCPLGQGPDPSTALTVEHSQISAAKQATEDSCSTECGDSGTIETCYNCVAGIIKDFPIYCIKCLKPILKEILPCLETNDDKKDVIDCVLASPVSDTCKSCICDILCHIEPSLCRLCHDESHSNGNNQNQIDSLRCGDKSWFYYPPGKVCYKLFPETGAYAGGVGDGTIKDQSEAKKTCQGVGGCLVTIDTKGKQQFIDRLVHRYYLYPDCRTDVNPRYCIWTSGNTTLEKPEYGNMWPKIKTWQWDNCSSIEPLSTTGFTNWSPGEPHYYPQHEAKGIHDTSIMFNQPALAGEGNWNNLNPNQQLSYMCQKPAIF